MRLTRYRRIFYFALSVLTILALQWSFLSMKIKEIPSDLYKKHAAELEVTPGWRYGYYRAHHGAVLVKTRNSGQLAPNNSDASGDGVRTAMAQELRLVPTKTYLEVGLYIILLAQAFFGAPWLIAKFLANEG